MRRFLLDTGILAALLNERPAVRALTEPWLARRETATSILAYGEVFEYIRPRPDFTARAAALGQLLRAVPPFGLTRATIRRYAELRMRRPHGQGVIGDVDTLIAAIAIERDMTVVTTDSDFRRVPALSVVLLDRETPAVVEP